MARFACSLCPDVPFDTIGCVDDHRLAAHPGVFLSAVLVPVAVVRPQSSYEAHCRACAALVVRTTPFPSDVVRCDACEAAR